MTPFARALSRLGLSQAEAAAALDVPYDTLASWCQGRRKTPASVWPKIAALAQKRGADCVALAREIEALVRDAA